MILEKLIVGPLEVNCYILASSSASGAVIIDPGAEAEKISVRLKELGLEIKYIVNTHGHIDHIGADESLAAPIYIHRLDAAFLGDPQLNLSAMLGLPLSLDGKVMPLEEGQRLEVGDIALEVIHTPGHTPGGVCLNAGKFCFTGDTLFAQGVGRTDIPSGSEEKLTKSIRKLMRLPDETVIYPGHGPTSTIGQERQNNPFI
ncbi:MAG: MBL fold metallo-hydrolase [Candidatus Omnitrophota bacterium]|nr:MAG: MBL fold metallo-hydrolase [Candidatus Omnitrophota bacterium]